LREGLSECYLKVFGRKFGINLELSGKDRVAEKTKRANGCEKIDESADASILTKLMLFRGNWNILFQSRDLTLEILLFLFKDHHRETNRDVEKGSDGRMYRSSEDSFRHCVEKPSENREIQKNPAQMFQYHAHDLV
jgi:hypothetical protein